MFSWSTLTLLSFLSLDANTRRRDRAARETRVWEMHSQRLAMLETASGVGVRSASTVVPALWTQAFPSPPSKASKASRWERSRIDARFHAADRAPVPPIHASMATRLAQ